MTIQIGYDRRAEFYVSTVFLLMSCSGGSSMGSGVPNYEEEEHQAAQTHVSLMGHADSIRERGMFEVWQNDSEPIWHVQYSAEVSDEASGLLHGIGLQFWLKGNVMRTLEVQHEELDNEGNLQALELSYWIRSSSDDVNQREWFLGEAGQLTLESVEDGVRIVGENVMATPAQLDDETLLLVPTRGPTINIMFEVQGPVDWRCIATGGQLETSGEEPSSAFCRNQVDLLIE